MTFVLPWGIRKLKLPLNTWVKIMKRLIEATDQYYSNNEDLYQIADFL